MTNRQRGQIAIFGKNGAGLPPEYRPVNTVFQHYALFPHLTVAQNIGFALRMLGRTHAQIDSAAARMVELVGLEGMEHRRPDQLSCAQKQRVVLALALAPGPKILLLDEPLSALDAKLRQRMGSERLQILNVASQQPGDFGPLTVSERIYMGNEPSSRREGAACLCMSPFRAAVSAVRWISHPATGSPCAQKPEPSGC